MGRTASLHELSASLHYVDLDSLKLRASEIRVSAWLEIVTERTTNIRRCRKDQMIVVELGYMYLSVVACTTAVALLV